MKIDISPLNDDPINSIRESYDRLAEEYTRRIFDELRHKPLDRELLDRFTKQTHGRGEVCDMGCGPGQVARYLRDEAHPSSASTSLPACWSRLEN
jgi:trans-aconitate methyltransferase